VGEILVEIVATSVGEGFLEPQPLVGPFPSGAPAIFIDQCARIGGAAAMIGTVGDDDFGRLNVGRLRRDGADVSAIAVDPELPTGCRCSGSTCPPPPASPTHRSTRRSC
jgi:fructokinase